MEAVGFVRGELGNDTWSLLWTMMRGRDDAAVYLSDMQWVRLATYDYWKMIGMVTVDVQVEEMRRQ